MNLRFKKLLTWVNSNTLTWELTGTVTWVNTNTLSWELIGTVMWVYTNKPTWELNRYGRTGPDGRTPFKSFSLPEQAERGFARSMMVGPPYK